MTTQLTEELLQLINTFEDIEKFQADSRSVAVAPWWVLSDDEKRKLRNNAAVVHDILGRTLSRLLETQLQADAMIDEGGPNCDGFD